MSDSTTSKPAKKRLGQTRKNNSAPVSVQALYMQAGQYIEASSMVRAVAQEIVERFQSEGMRPPALLLKRAGTGPRAATMESILVADNALGEVACQLELRARELLGLPAAVGTKQTPSGEQIVVDSIVPLESAEAEFKTVGIRKPAG